ncbi:MAG: cupin domain-containing protein [Acidobacteria bacterium]|nr:cupin domain-containing protein [Acidobacteriota bacterium]
MRILKSLVYILAGSVITLAAQSVVNQPRYVSPNGATELKVLLDASTLGGTEVDVGELSFSPNLDSGEHVHGSTEIFYVLSGELEHVVNGKSTFLKPGMIGFVRPPDKVRHKTGAAATKALVIWVPGGEAARISSRWKRVEGVRH